MKRILIALLMAAVVLSTAACTGNETPDTPDVPEDDDDFLPEDEGQDAGQDPAEDEPEIIEEDEQPQIDVVRDEGLSVDVR